MKAQILFILLLFTSCNTLKNKTSNSDKSEGKETIETTIKRKGDTVSFVVPKITYVDTTIYTVNRQGTTLKTVYDSKGQISNIDCFASVIEEIRKENREFKNNIKESAKHKTVEQNFDWLIYIMVGFILVISLALILFYIYILKTKLNI